MTLVASLTEQIEHTSDFNSATRYSMIYPILKSCNFLPAIRLRRSINPLTKHPIRTTGYLTIGKCKSSIADCHKDKFDSEKIAGVDYKTKDDSTSKNKSTHQLQQYRSNSAIQPARLYSFSACYGRSGSIPRKDGDFDNDIAFSCLQASTFSMHLQLVTL